MSNAIIHHTKYNYHSLPNQLGSVRLLTVLPAGHGNSVIQCSLTDGNIYNSRYKALSYVWGPPDPAFLIQLDAQPFYVRKSLYNFLLKAQSSLSRQALWIDALCINQNDISERNSQVQQMSVLYQNADTVIVWLEDVIQPSECHLIDRHGAARAEAELCTSWLTPRHEWKTEWHDFSDREAQLETLAATISQQFWYEDHPDVHNLRLSALHIPSVADIEALQSVVIRIATHPYWQRAWILQEFYQGQHLQLVTKVMSFPVTHLLRLYAWLKQATYDAHTALIEQMQASLFYCRQYSSYLLGSDREDEAVMDLQQGLQNFGIRACADVRDRVFSLVGMCDKQASTDSSSGATTIFKVDYNQTRLGVYTAVVKMLTVSRRGGVLNPWDASYCELLVEALEITPKDLGSVFLDKTQSKVKCQYLLNYDMRDASDNSVLIIPNVGHVADKALWCCTCLACKDLEVSLAEARRFVLVRLSKLWLILSEVDDELSLAKLEGIKFGILACARQIRTHNHNHSHSHNENTMTTTGNSAQHFLAFAPQTLIQKLLCRSQVTIDHEKLHGRLRATLHLDEKSLLALPVACRDGRWDGDATQRQQMFTAGLDEPPHEVHGTEKLPEMLEVLRFDRKPLNTVSTSTH